MKHMGPPKDKDEHVGAAPELRHARPVHGANPITALWAMRKTGRYARLSRGIIFGWVFIVVFAHMLYHSYGNINTLTIIAIMLCSVLIGMFSCIALPPLLWKMGELIGRQDAGSRYDKTVWRDRLSLFACAFLPLLLWYVAFFPGCFSHDSISQLHQALDGEYTDWHPVLQTLITFTLPLMISGGRTWTIVLFQIIELGLALTYLGMTVRLFAPRWCTYTAVLLISLSPVTGDISMHPWKDILFTITIIVWTSQVVRIRMSQGKWLSKPQNIVGFVLCALVSCIARHNGVLFVGPMLLYVILAFDRKRAIALATCVVALVLVVRGPFYSALGVTQPGGRSVEVLGMPMSALGGVMHDTPGALDAETRDFLLEVSPQSAWSEFSSERGFNGVKFKSVTDSHAIERRGVSEVLSMTLRAFLASPMAALHSPIALFSMVHLPAERVTWAIEPAITSDEYITKYTGFEPLAEALRGILSSSKNGLMSIPLWHTGFIELFLIAAVAMRIDGKTFDWFLGIPLLLHNMGTTLLLTGSDFRFFWLSFPVGILVIAYLVLGYSKSASTL